jgi:hypothetical protein
VDWLVEASVLEKHALYIFMAEVMGQDSEGPCVRVRVRARARVCVCVGCRVAGGEV